MTSFATAEDLATFLGHDVDASRADMMLASATAAIKRRTNQLIERSQSTVRLRVVQDQVTLPQRPVVSVDSMSRLNFDGTSNVITGYLWDGKDKLYGANRLTWVINTPEIWVDQPYPVSLEVTYTHGYATIPQDLVDICLQRAARAYELPAAGAVMQEQTGDYMYRLNESFVGTFLPDEIAIMRNYSRRAGTSALR